MATPSLTALPLPLRPVRESDARRSGATEAESDDQLAAPPTTAMFLSGVSCYGHESHTKQGAGKTPMFDVTREAHDRHGNPVCYERTGKNQRVKLRHAKEAWLRAHKARAATEEAEAPLTTEYRHLTSAVKPPTTQFTPKFVKLDRQVLRYFGWFKEPILYSRIESYRVRRVSVCYYLVDDTLAIEEQPEDNSGIDQGEILKRQKVYHDGSNRAVTPLDLKVGATVQIFGHAYHIVDADGHTRDLLRDMFGIPLGDAMPYEEAPYHPTPTAFSHRPKPTTIGVDVGFEEDHALGFYHRKPDTLHKFLENDRKVLSFMCEWDDSSRLYGERRQFKLNFYLSDDTIEVNESPATTRGRGPFTRLLSRQRVPLPGAATIRTYPWAKEKEAAVQVDKAPRTPPRQFRDAVHLDCRGDGYCGVLARDRMAAMEGAGSGAGSSRRGSVRPATAGGRPGTAASAAAAGRPSSARGNRRPVTAPGPRRMKRSVMDGDDALYERRDVNPITGLPTYDRATAWDGDNDANGPCCVGAAAVQAHDSHHGRAAPSVGAAASGAGMGAGMHADLPARFLLKADYYTAKDLRCGSTICVFGRELLLRDCDSFTKQWYHDNLELEQQALPKTPPRRGSVLDLELPPGKVVDLRPPTPPPTKMGEAPPDINSHTLSTDPRHVRALLRIITDDPDQQTRRFIMSLFVGDGSSSIFEQVIVNSGHPGGKFLERGFHRNADAPVDRNDPMLLLPQLFRPTDLYEGAVLRFHHCPDQRFEVLRVDNSASGLSDEMVDEKPTVTELDMLLARVAWRLDGRVASVVKTLEGYDWRVQGAVDADVAFAVFRQLRVTQDVVSDEELRTVLAAFKRPKDGFVEYKRLLTALINTPVPLLKAELLFKDGGTPPRSSRDKWHEWHGESKREEVSPEREGRGKGAAPPRFNADSPLLVAATEAPAVPEAELLQRRLRLLLGNASPKLLRHFFRLQDPAHGGFVGSHCFFAALEQAGLELCGTDRAFLQRTLFPSAHSCVEYARLLESLFGPTLIAQPRTSKA